MNNHNDGRITKKAIVFERIITYRHFLVKSRRGKNSKY